MTQLQRANGQNAVRTSVRFPMELAVLLDTDRGQIEATTIDVSANGLLFSATRLPAVGTRIVFTMTMPSAIMGSETDVSVHCMGRIVRHHQSDDVLKAAAVIDEYYLKV